MTRKPYHRRPLVWIGAALALAGAVFVFTSPELYGLLLGYHLLIHGWAAAHPAAAALLYLAVFVLTVALALPTAGTLLVLGGYLFGLWWGTGLGVLGAAGGGTLFLVIGRRLAGEQLQARLAQVPDGVWRRLITGLRRDAYHYLAALRLVPLFPFFLINMAAAALNLRPLPFFFITLLGLIPSTFIFAGLGVGFGEVLAAGRQPDLGILYRPEILLPLSGLAILALAPVIYRRFRIRRGEDG